VELAALAKAKWLVTAVGLQARVNPALMHMKELVEAGLSARSWPSMSA
jgi:predicted dehydrogenase